MSDEQRLIDTNVLVHAYVLADPRKHEIAKHIVQEVWNEGGGVVTLQNICEFFYVVTKKLEHPLPVNKAGIIVERLTKTSQWLVIPVQIIIRLGCGQRLRQTELHLEVSLMVTVIPFLISRQGRYLIMLVRDAFSNWD